MAEQARILYVSGRLPALSETFVYREILALRDRGIGILTASVHAPGKDLGSVELDRMARETISVYGVGWKFVIKQTFAELVSRPLDTLQTLAQVATDAVGSRDIRLRNRPKVLWQGLAALSLARRARLAGVTHIHAHMANTPTTIAMYAAKQLGIGFSFTGHANDLFPNRILLSEKLRRARWVNCISYWHRSFYMAITSRPSSDYPIVRCGVDTKQYRASPQPFNAVLEVLGVGRLVEKKGFDALIEGARIFARRGGVPLRVRIAGSGEQEMRLRSLCQNLPTQLSVELLGSVSNERVLNLMVEADVFVIPCCIAYSGDRDGIPVVLMEAMARGRCVVSGDLETIRELVEHERNGIMIRPGDPQAVALALGELAKDRAKIQRLGQAARSRVENEFDLGVNTDRIVAAMAAHGVLSQRSAGTSPLTEPVPDIDLPAD